VINKLSLAELRYYDLKGVCESLNYSLGEIKNILAAQGVGHGDSVTDAQAAQIEYALGPALTEKAATEVKAVLERFKKDEIAYLNAAQALRQALVKRYPPKQVRRVTPEAKLAKEKWPTD
jgi:hypothetical protein